MRYPCLIPKNMCKTPAEVCIEQEGVTHDGEPFPSINWSGNVNYQDKAKTVYTDEKKKIVLTGCALIPGDIAPSLAVISAGTINVNGEKRSIYQGTKARNPDGTVNYTRLDVM